MSARYEKVQSTIPHKSHTCKNIKQENVHSALILNIHVDDLIVAGLIFILFHFIIILYRQRICPKRFASLTHMHVASDKKRQSFNKYRPIE